MEFDTTLAKDFDGTFKFTNWTDEDFTAKWGGKEYTFPKNSRSPILIPDQSPLEIQNIRKKWAQKLAEREFEKTERFGQLKAQERNPDGSPRLNSIHQAGSYSLSDLAALIQRCLEPLPMKSASVVESKKISVEDKLTRNEEGELNTAVVDKKTSLRKKALEA